MINRDTVKVREREREREGERQTDRYRERGKGGKTNRQTDRQRHRQTARKTQTDRQIDSDKQRYSESPYSVSPTRDQNESRPLTCEEKTRVPLRDQQDVKRVISRQTVHMLPRVT